jgi:hypothetical protein
MAITYCHILLENSPDVTEKNHEILRSVLLAAVT